MRWRKMSTAPKDGTQILVRRHNDCMYEFYVVWWGGDKDEQYPWHAEHTAYPEDRLDNWLPIPGPRC
jgi:hypothetical protein